MVKPSRKKDLSSRVFFNQNIHDFIKISDRDQNFKIEIELEIL